MATPVRELDYGDVEVYVEETLGVGSYGKVCKAKCGQLPCAVKLLHDTLFGTNDPGIGKFVEQFEQECRFLRMIKHPNIVQFLGTVRDPQSRRLALLMELMDVSLTRFLEQSTGPLPYHTQLNICHDVALALAYLHSNDVIHRDLSSNNILLIGEGSRAKVTDFGMSKLIGMNPRMTPLTMCPGTQAYMPPEALIQPPRYSNKLDCFSHGVLTIQVVTRQFPNPTDPTTTIEDTRSPTGTLQLPVPERERRNKDIDLVDPNHPLLPLALHCLKDRDTERLSADELCGRLATLKSQPKFASSLENSPLQALQREIETKVSELERVSARLGECEEELKAKEQTVEQVISDCQAALQAKTAEYQQKTAEYESVIEQLHKELRAKQKKLKSETAECEGKQSTAKQQLSCNLLRWRQGAQSPVGITSSWGTAVVHHDTVYVSKNERVFAFSITEDRWTKLEPSRYKDFCMAVARDKLTTIGGYDGIKAGTNCLLCLSESTSASKWEELLPPMSTERVGAAAVTTPKNLVVAGGRSDFFDDDGLHAVEILDLDSLQWSSASSSPQALQYPHMTLCGEHLYVSQHNTVFSCSVEELLKSCKPASTNSSDVWSKLADTPVPRSASLTTLRGQVLAIGGRNHGRPTGAINRYDRTTNSWSVIGEMPTPRSLTLVAVLPSNELVAVGGQDATSICGTTEIASTD